VTAAISTPSEGSPEPPWFVAALGLELWQEGELMHGRMELRPGMWVPGTTHPRMALLATAVDVIAGNPPTGPINPTVDLRLRLLSTPPASGLIDFECRVVKTGRRLFVAEAFLYAHGSGAPFGRSAITFMNQPLPAPAGFEPRFPPAVAVPFDELVGARHLGQGTVAVDLRPGLSNGPGGTVQGGVQAYLADLASERVLAADGRFVATDLEIRYLNRVRAGPLMARAEVLSRRDSEAELRVPLTEAGDPARIVSLVALTYRAADPPS
jgi:acyl-coenzyme A thioesterase PaaI-like protein